MKAFLKTITACLVTIILLYPLIVFADGSNTALKYTVSGDITDQATGEALLGASIYIHEIEKGTSTNVYGFYSISLPPGDYTLRFSYIGYGNIEKKITLKSNITLNIELVPGSELLEEVIIKGERSDRNIRDVEMSTVKMDAKTISRIPAFMGEVDVIKAIQLLPGVQTAAEGSSGFSVRGGNTDQNLILLDEAIVYNASHLMGFFSVFNNDVVKDVTLYKGDIPASEGGRLSSLLDVRMKEGNKKKISGTGGIGTISSRLALEGPIVKDKSSFIVAGRRTYADVFLNFSNNEELRKAKLYFYDFNTKVNYRINDNNHVFVSGYYGKDVFGNQNFKMGWGNSTLTARWNHLFSKKVFSNFTFFYSKYNYSLGVPEGEANSFDWSARITDYGGKANFIFYPNPLNTIKFGASVIHHNIMPGSARGLGSESFITEYTIPPNSGLESAIYISNEQKIGTRFTAKYGLRYSFFNNVGPGTVYNYDENFNSIDSVVYSGGDFFNMFSGLEPRIGLAFMLNKKSSVKVNYSRTIQYIQLASNSTAGTPLDIWFMASPNVQPQTANQGAIGYFRNFKDNAIETSIEVYYKEVRNAIDFKDHAELLLNKQLEGEIRFGDARSYGLEVLVKLTEGKLTGWVGYTLSRSERMFPDINKGRTYLSPYDKTHDISIVLSYSLNERINFGFNWVYATGSPVTFPTGRAIIGNKVLPIYSDRNSYRMPDYHRMDLSFTYIGKKRPGRSYRDEWNFSVYNAYGRKNAWVINFQQDENDPNTTYAEMTYLFGIIPAITYNFKF